MNVLVHPCSIEGCCYGNRKVTVMSMTPTTSSVIQQENKVASVELEDTDTLTSTITAVSATVTASTTSSNDNKNTVLIALPPVTLHQEISQALLKMPTTLNQLGNDILAHLVNQPKRPTWNIQTTIILGFMQAFRDHTYTNSLDFWRFVLIAPTFLTPLTSCVQDASFKIRPRPLACVGVLRKCDQQEKQATSCHRGSRLLEAEWMSALSVWDYCRNLIWPSLPVANLTSTSKAKKKSLEKIILYFHGGAYCAMSAQTHRTLTHKISKATGRRVFAINYRLAPEYKWPCALYDAVQSFLHLIDPLEEHSFDPKRIMVIGDSAGGGLALAMLLYLRDHGLPSPEGACLLSPWVDLTFSYPSWDKASLSDYLPNNPDKLTGMNPQKLYLGDNFSMEMLKHPYVSPLFADHFENLPPIMVQSGSCESLRDEIEALYQKINESKTTFIHNEVYEDMVHVFQAFPLGKVVEEAVASIGWWSKTGASMILKCQLKHQPVLRFSNTGELDLSVNARRVSPRLLGRRYRSIPG